MGRNVDAQLNNNSEYVTAVCSWVNPHWIFNFIQIV